MAMRAVQAFATARGGRMGGGGHLPPSEHDAAVSQGGEVAADPAQDANIGAPVRGQAHTHTHIHTHGEREETGCDE